MLTGEHPWRRNKGSPSQMGSLLVGTSSGSYKFHTIKKYNFGISRVTDIWSPSGNWKKPRTTFKSVGKLSTVFLSKTFFFQLECIKKGSHESLLGVSEQFINTK